MKNIDQSTFDAMSRAANAAGWNGVDVELNATDSGFTVFITAGGVLHNLVTDKGRPRFFKSPTTVLSFLAERGVPRVEVTGIAALRKAKA